MSFDGMADNDAALMAVALDLAKVALTNGDFPVGCVIANGNTVIAQGRRTGTADSMANEIDHAEINALRFLYRHAPPALDRLRLTIYCTMEPCLMCFSAIMLSGIGRVVYAYEDVMGGGTGCDRSSMSPLYRDNPVTVIAGVLRESSLMLFQQFFAESSSAYWADSLLSRYTLEQQVSS